MRVVIAEDEALLREGLVLLLSGAGFDVAGVCADADELVRVAAAERPDLVITDIRMPPGHSEDGLRAAVEIRVARPSTAVLVLSQHVHRRYVGELLGERPSGVGYLLKQRVVDGIAFCQDARTVGEGGTVLDPVVVAAMISRARHGNDAIARLTPRQSEVLALVAEGRSNAAIGRRLAITEKAVVQHASNIYDLLGLVANDEDHRRVLAVVRYLNR